MILNIATWFALVASVGAAKTRVLQTLKAPDLKADSKIGMKLLSKARQLQYNGNQWNGNNQQNNGGGNYNQWNGNQQNDYNAYGNNQANKYNNGNNYYNENWNDNQNQQQFQNYYMAQHSWVADFSLKFLGCHDISHWNDEAEDQEDARVVETRLVRFRLCPTSFCSSSMSDGCDGSYGDYVVDLESFLEAYYEAKNTYDEWAQDANQGYNGQQQQQDGGEEADIANYLQCQQANIDYQQDENAYYNGAQQQDEDWDGSYYMGPYCSSQGGQIMVGIFKDEYCSRFADNNQGRNIYYQATGYTLPFSQSSMIELDCIPCSEPKDQDYNNGGDDQDDANEVAEFCENMYTVSGKCEQELPYGTAAFPNNAACNFLEGVKLARDDGTVLTTHRSAPGHLSTSNKAAAVFISVFSVATVLLAAYVYYLKTKLDRASINLAD